MYLGSVSKLFALGFIYTFRMDALTHNLLQWKLAAAQPQALARLCDNLDTVFSRHERISATLKRPWATLKWPSAALKRPFRSPETEVGNPETAIANPETAVGNPETSVRNPETADQQP